ncbi:prepilin-type N-terminal cleavage/methylation domain-containing protein, partial [Myxococcus sp. 1LA]
MAPGHQAAAERSRGGREVSRRDARGATLLEVSIVLAILAVLAAMAYAGYAQLSAAGGP